MANSVDDSGRKPYCVGDRIECFSMKDMTLIEMSFSNTLDITERSDKRLACRSLINPNIGRSTCIIDNGASRRRTRNARFRADALTTRPLSRCTLMQLVTFDDFGTNLYSLSEIFTCGT